MPKKQADVCTTQEAAKLLGMSVSSVQNLVETEVLGAWKTNGGHRRIPLQEVLSFKAALKDGGRLAAASSAGTTTMLVLEDDEMQRSVYDAQFTGWNLPLIVHYCKTGYEALIEIGARPPDIFLADIMMQGIDGYEVVETIVSKPHLQDMSILIVSGISRDELEQRGGIPAGVEFFKKPIQFEELRGYVRACCARKQRALK